MTDDQLVALAKSGHKEAVSDLYEKYFPYIYKFFYYQLGNSVELSEDLTQDTFVEMAKSIVKFRGDSSFKNWLYTLAKYRLNHYLKKKYQLPTVSLFESVSDNNGWVDPEDQAKKVSKVAKLLSLLSPKDKKLVELRYLRGYTVKESAQKLGLSESNIKVSCFRIIKKLQKKV